MNISLIDFKGRKNKSQNEILKSINNYLLRNKGAISDFMLVKDIVDRNIDKTDDQITSSIPTPLYLGLMGTMLGIIGGLYFMPTIAPPETVEPIIGALTTAKSDPDENTKLLTGIDSLLDGVKIAMIASVFGLILTVISNIVFLSIRKSVENQKNDLFTFIQTELLPILSKNTTSSLHTLQTNLLKFNSDFTTNMNQFSGIILAVKDTFDSQLDVVEELKRIDVANIAKYNIDVMQQLKSSFRNLKDLSEYLLKTNSLLKNTEQLNLTINNQLDKVGDISEMVKKFDSHASHISDNSKYLASHFENFDEREQAINNRMIDYDRNTGKMIDELSLSFQNRKDEFNKKDVEISSDFNKLFENLKAKTEKVFDDESGNIKAIMSNVKEVKSDVDNLQGVSSELSGLKKSVSFHDDTIKDLLEIIKTQSIVVERPKIINIGTIAFLSIGIITCLVAIYKLLTY
ncbi:hypothetical protein [Maribacter spongiicola]|uniref:hypothetical protein n=1 Tax=Maribacter spongiicola TaxID=1206753 RepID=UPI003F9D3199